MTHRVAVMMTGMGIGYIYS